MSARVLEFRRRGATPPPLDDAAKAAALAELNRGVRKAWWRIDGCEVLLAVIGTGDRIGQAVLRPGVDEHDAIVALEQLLDVVDPVGPLQ